VSKALHFKHEVPVTVRFSANTGARRPPRHASPPHPRALEDQAWRCLADEDGLAKSITPPANQGPGYRGTESE